MQLLGETTALASFVVVRRRTDGTEIGTFGFTYLLRTGEGAWQIAVLIGHPPHDVLRSSEAPRERLTRGHWITSVSPGAAPGPRVGSVGSFGRVFDRHHEEPP